MSLKVYVKHGGEDDSTVEDISAKVRIFEVTTAGAYGQGTGSQGDFDIVDDDGSVEVYEHNRVTITEDASGDELILQYGPIVRIEGGRGPGQKQGARRQLHITFGDANSELHGLALRADWVRGAETATDRAIAAIETFCQGDPRFDTNIVAVRWDDEEPHLVKPNPDDGEVMMPAHTYEMGTMLPDILRECAETEGQDWGVRPHDVGGETHLCFQWHEEDDFEWMSTLSISDDPTEVDDDTVFAPWWRQGAAISRGGADPVLSTIISEYGDQRGHVLEEDLAVIAKHNYHAEKMTDATTTTQAGAESRAPHLLRGRSKEDVSHSPSILVPASKAHLIRPGMGIQIRSAAARYEEAVGATVTRKVAQVKVVPWTPKKIGAERLYMLDLTLARPKKLAKQRRPVALLRAPTPPTDPEPGGTVRLYHSDHVSDSSDSASALEGPPLGAADVDPAWEYDNAGAWEAFMLYDSPQGSGNGLAAWDAINAAAGDATVRGFVYKLDENPDILAIIQSGGTVKGQNKARSRYGTGISEAAQNNLFDTCGRIVDGSGNELAVLWDVGDLTGDLKFPAQAMDVNRSFSGSFAAYPSATGADFLLIEYGAKHLGPTSAGTGIAMRFTDTAGSDLPEDQSTTSALNSWVEFSGASSGGSSGTLPGPIVNPGEESQGSGGEAALAQHTHPHGLLLPPFMHGALTLQPELTHADVDPTSSDDADDGYRPGWVWINDDTDAVFVLVDATQAAAVWRQMYPASASITVEEDGDTPVTDVDHIVIDGATVTDDGGGQVTISAFGGGSGLVATGQYTGNGATDRTISLAFTPKLVIISAQDRFYVSTIGATGYGLRVTGTSPSASVNNNSTRPGLTTNGFIVSGTDTTHTNFNGRTNDYIAFG